MWDFIQNQILGMKWLNAAIGKGLSLLGLDTATRWGGSVQFFFYDVIKITILLCTLIFLISYIQSYFPPERSRKILGPLSRHLGQHHRRSAGDGNAVLLLFVYPSLYRLYQRRTSSRCDVLLLDFFPDGGPGQFGPAYEYLWYQGCRGLCDYGPCHRRGGRDAH